MKKIILAIVALVLVTATSTFAHVTNNETKVDERVERSFKKEFSSAIGTSWSKINDVYKVQFELNGQIMFAFLNEEGLVLGAYRNILTSQLPMSLSKSLKEDYTGYWISELFEMAKDNQTNYFITIENGEQKIVLRSENANFWSVKTKIKK